ncbi:2-iminobutanoate/2-iminopropanoate deaminase [Sphingomonas sp. UYAg733]
MKQIGGPVVTPTGQILPLSAAIEANGLVFVSGQLPMRDGAIVGVDIATQTGAVIDAIEAVLDKAGLTLAAIVKTTVWITRIEDFAAFNAVYAARFAAPYPARATVVTALAVPGALVEIDAIAVS